MLQCNYQHNYSCIMATQTKPLGLRGEMYLLIAVGVGQYVENTLDCL